MNVIKRFVLLQPCVCRWSRACSQHKGLHHRSTASNASRKVTTCSVETDTQLDPAMHSQASLSPKHNAPSPPMLANASSHVQGSASLKSPASHSNGHVKMQVARLVKPGQQAPLVHKMVPPPRQGKATVAQQPLQQQVVLQNEQTAAQRQPAAVLEQRNSAHNRAIRAEMASMASELQTKKAQLGKADAALRHVNLDLNLLISFPAMNVYKAHSLIVNFLLRLTSPVCDVAAALFSKCTFDGRHAVTR